MTKHNLQIRKVISLKSNDVRQETQHGLLGSQRHNIPDKNLVSVSLKMCFNFVLCAHEPSERDGAVLLFWKAAFIVKRRSSDDWLRQPGRACHCLASLCSINAWHTWKHNSATWFAFQQENYQLLLNNAEGKRSLFLSTFFFACLLHLFL